MPLSTNTVSTQILSPESLNRTLQIRCPTRTKLTVYLIIQLVILANYPVI